MVTPYATIGTLIAAFAPDPNLENNRMSGGLVTTPEEESRPRFWTSSMDLAHAVACEIGCGECSPVTAYDFASGEFTCFMSPFAA